MRRPSDRVPGMEGIAVGINEINLFLPLHLGCIYHFLIANVLLMAFSQRTRLL